MSIFWGDLHNHNEIGYGKGSLERSYEIAKSNLDFFAFTPHCWWPDIPGGDTAFKRHHLRGFEKARENWDAVISKANQMYEAGTFVPMIACEWHSSRWGDYCIYFPGGNGRLCHAAGIRGLKSFVRANGALMIPHHCAYPVGSRGTDWDEHDEGLSPVAEIFSEHGDCFQCPSPYGMYRHSMGGAQKSQTVLEQLKKGRIIGFTAGTDDHYGYPGSYGEGLTAVHAEELSREAVFEAIKRRHTYAVTGDRIALDFRLGEASMGDVLPVETERAGRVEVCAGDELDYVELLKNGRPLKRWGAPVGRRANKWILGLECGWGRMGGDETVKWDISVKVRGGEMSGASGCFCGGPGILDDINQFSLAGPRSLSAHMASSRRNVYPTQKLTVNVRGGPETKVAVSVKAKSGGHYFRKRFSHALGELAEDDSYTGVSEAFVSPRMRCYVLPSPGAMRMALVWGDREPRNPAFYYVKVVQRNGHCAWSSPIWCIRKHRPGR